MALWIWTCKRRSNHTCEKLVQLLVEHWQIVGVLWLAVNCGVFLLLAPFHLFRKRKQRDPSAPEKAE